MYEMPFQRAVERMARPRAIFSKLSAGKGLGAASRLSGNNGKVHKFADGGIMDENYYDPMEAALSAPDINGILGGPHSGPTLGIPGYSYQEAMKAPRDLGTTTQNEDGSLTFAAPEDNPGMSSGPTGFAGWMQNKHAGLKGSDWMKAGLTALTGILSGIASKRTSQGRFARGGIVCMADGGQAPAQMMAPQAQQAQPQAQGQPEDAQSQALVANAIKALLGQSQNPEADIQAFVAHFGQEALQALMQKVQESAGGQGGQGQAPQQAMAGGGILSGPGDGMSDSIPANGGQLRVGNGEYVLDADTVSNIGNGSTEAGARKLDAARMALRKMKTGRTSQPPAVHDRHNPMLKALR